MTYTADDYQKDLTAPGFPHAKSRKRFKAFYDRLGEDQVQIEQQAVPSRIEFIKPKGKIIELGCHSGFNCGIWADRGFHCVGVDVSESLIELGRRRYPQVEFICGFIEDLPSLEKYDTVVLTETLEHVIDPAPVIDKAVELLADGGMIYVSCPSERIGTNSHLRGISVEEMETLLKDAGLQSKVWQENHGYPETYAKAWI